MNVQKTLTVVAVSILPLLAYSAEPAWQRLVDDAQRFELQGRNIRCPLEAVKLDGGRLEVSYWCDGPEGRRDGRFYGRQSGPDSFSGHFVLRTRFRYLGGSMRIKFSSAGAVVISARGERIPLRLLARP